MGSLSTLKLCFLAGTLGQGGAERQLYHILQALCRAGATPRLLSFSQGEHWEQPIAALGVRITRVGESASRCKRLLRILKELRQNRPDVLQSQHFFTNAYCGFAARSLGLCGIGAMRNDGASEARACGRIGGWLNLRLPGVLAANSEAAIRYAVGRGIDPSRVHFLPNVVDTDWFKPAAEAFASAGPPVLLAVGRLVRQKRMDRFIFILGFLRKVWGLDVRGLIVGAGRAHEDLEAQLRRQAASLGLTPEVLEFRGETADMRPVYHAAAVCVLVSDHEGTPNVLLEAMASGLPVVATRVGGVAEIVEHGRTGFLRAPADLEQLIADLVELVRNVRVRTEMGRRARAFVEARHNLRRLPAYLTGLYRGAVPAPPRPATPFPRGVSA